MVAHHGAMPVELQVGADRVDAGWFVDTMVVARHQTTATGAQLLIDANDAFTIGLSLGQTDRVREMALHLGWSQVAPLQTYVLMLKPRAVLRGKVNPVVAHAADFGIRAQHQLRRQLARRPDSGLEVRLVDRFDARHDQLWQAVRHDYGCAVTRDASCTCTVGP